MTLKEAKISPITVSLALFKMFVVRKNLCLDGFSAQSRKLIYMMTWAKILLYHLHLLEILK